MATFLFSAFIVTVFWLGYWRGWADAKQESATFAIIDRLYEIARERLTPNR